VETARRLAAQLILTCAYAQAETTLREHGFEPPDFSYTVGMAFFLSSIPTPSTPRFGRWGWIER
jgi:hypothetical protein